MSTTPTVEKTDEQIWAELVAADPLDGGVTKSADDDPVADSKENDNASPSADAAAAVDPPAQADTPAAAAQPNLDWSKVPPEYKAAYDGYRRNIEAAPDEQSRRSAQGRIDSLIKRFADRKEAEARRPTDPPGDEDAADPIDQLAAEYPEIAEPLRKTVEPLKKTVDAVRQAEESRQQAADREMDDLIAANTQALEEAHPGWLDYVVKEGPKFINWVNDQPAKTRQAYIQNRDAVFDAQAAIDLVSSYKAFAGAAPNPDPTPAPAAGNPKPSLDPRRAAQLQATASPSNVRGRPQPTGIPESGDPATIWKALADADPQEQEIRRQERRV